jgi:hypothetical protein
LKFVDDRDEIIETDDSFELETRAIVTRPDHISFDSAHNRQADYDPVTALQLSGVVDHETVGRKVADMQVQVAVHKVLNDCREIDRMTRRATQIGYTKICSASHALRSSPFSGSNLMDDAESLIIRKGGANSTSLSAMN